MREPADLADWNLHCYCPAARETPHSVVREGTNGHLLYQARDGTTAARLRAAGLDVTEDQVARLVAFGLLERDGDRLRTRFPVLGGTTSFALRQRLRPQGAVLAGRMAPRVAEVRRELTGQGLAGGAYAVVFGYALDGLLWTRLRARGAVPETALSAERPQWNGAFWAVYPGRDRSSGTNFVDCGTSTLVLVWDEATSSDLNALTRAEQLRPAVAAVVAGAVAGVGSEPGAVTDGQGRRWRLRRPDGRPAVPLLGTGARLDVVAGQVADLVAEALSGREVDAARELVPGGDRAVATVVLAHELIWDVTEALIGSGDLQPPETLVERLYLHANSGRRST